MELILNLQPFNFSKEVGKGPPDLYCIKLELGISEEHLNQKIEELQLNSAACTFLGDNEVCYQGLKCWCVAIKLQAKHVLRPQIELALTSSLKQILNGKTEIYTIAVEKGLLIQRKN